jgi:hypothetical protein
MYLVSIYKKRRLNPVEIVLTVVVGKYNGEGKSS